MVTGPSIVESVEPNAIGGLTSMNSWRVHVSNRTQTLQLLMGAVMSKQRPPFNPCSFADSLSEKYFAKSPAKRKKLNDKREKLVVWLRKKWKSNQRSQALADKLEACRPKRRCLSPACPVCADAAQRLFTKTTRRYVKGKSGVACVTIVPADGTTKRGGL
jgi:hypothetical protein